MPVSRRDFACSLPFWGVASLTTSQNQPLKPQEIPPEILEAMRVYWEYDKWTKNIQTDTIVIHHTSQPPGITWQALSELQSKTLYVPRYSMTDLKGQTPWSGHLRLVNGVLTEVFYTYHWLIRQDGSTERLLLDSEVGWHAGNWEENLRSIAICFDGDFSDTPPSRAALAACAKLIRWYSQQIPLTRLKGHNEIRKTTKCPGVWFDSPIDKKRETGRKQLLKLANIQLEK